MKLAASFYHVWWLLKEAVFSDGSFLFTANVRRNNSSWTLLELFPLEGKLSCGRARLGGQATYWETTSVTVRQFFREEPRPAAISSSLLGRYGLSLRSDGNPGKIARSTSCCTTLVSLQARSTSRIVETVSFYIIDAKTCSRRRWWDLPANVRLVPAYFHQGSILDVVFHFSSFNSFCNNAPHFVNARYSWIYLLTVFPKDILQLHQALSYPSIFQVGPILISSALMICFHITKFALWYLKNCSKFLPTSSLPPIADLFKIVQFSEFSTQSYASFWS